MICWGNGTFIPSHFWFITDIKIGLGKVNWGKSRKVETYLSGLINWTIKLFSLFEMVLLTPLSKERNKFL